ncbi:hypothetical protein E2C01_086839 [Portunus trituberculatus]|uniref:Uncharacterized protein n=1 Tax=Portunus trituberculatus TaxID=210409 RepID=A0A5B7J1W8_PORTR|nr:hypothetical protein [Portunus trituberculatus]
MLVFLGSLPCQKRRQVALHPLLLFRLEMFSRGDRQPYCEDCLVPLTVRHLLIECPSLMDLRNRYLYRCRGRVSDYMVFIN